MKAEIYSKPHCPFCVKAKALFVKHDIEFTEMDAVVNRLPLIERVTKETGEAPKTVPQIWIDGQYIGGHDKLVLWLEDISQEVDYKGRKTTMVLSRKAVHEMNLKGIDLISETVTAIKSFVDEEA